MKVILASASPRRRELLSLLLEEFDCCSADIDETPIADELPEDYVLRMAVEKASAVKNERGVIIGSDTVVVLSGNILQTGLCRGCAGNVERLEWSNSSSDDSSCDHDRC